MKHALKFKSLEEKIVVWLDLCDFCLRLMKKSLSYSEFKKRLKRLRSAHLKENHLILSKLAHLK